jgi:hypothetical protein
MLAWLNMGNIPPHLRAVTFKVAARGGVSVSPMLAWLNMGNIPPHLRAVTFKVAARGGVRAKGRRPGNFSGVGGNFLLFWEGKIPRILAAVLINVRVLLHIWRLSPSIQTVDTPKVKAVTPQATGTTSIYLRGQA